jgi:hypothetical protein
VIESPDALEVRAINAALEAADFLDLSFARLEREGACAVGHWPHQAALYALTVEEIGKEAASNLVRLSWVPDWAELDRSTDVLDSDQWIVVGEAKHWPRVLQREPTLAHVTSWPFLAPDALRHAATCLELMVRSEVLEAHHVLVGGQSYWLSEWVWDSLRTVTHHVHDAVVDETTGNTVWRGPSDRHDRDDRHEKTAS